MGKVSMQHLDKTCGRPAKRWHRYDVGVVCVYATKTRQCKRSVDVYSIIQDARHTVTVHPIFHALSHVIPSYFSLYSHFYLRFNLRDYA